MAEDNPRSDALLFAQCYICIICSRTLDNDLAETLASTIRSNGGEVVIHQSPAPLPPVQEFSHIISSTIDFPGHDAICDALIPVVKPQWIQASTTKNKLANPRQFNPDPRLFLNDVVVSCVDIPEGDKDAIIGGVLAMGGLYTTKITVTTTHLVALNMDSDKCRMAKSKLKIKIVLPHWFDDCLKLGKRIDERPYTLPDPEILRVEANAPVKMTENKDIIGASTPEPKDLPSNDSRDDLDVFQGKKVMLSEDLAIGDHLLQSIQQLITNGGGTVTDDVQETDIYVCRYRDGDDYRTASRLGKEVGSLSWLYHLITHNTWTSPLRRLLHYPIAKEGIPGFKDLKISLSNYAGEARIYLENLIVASGAECTKTLKQDNTHLISGHGNSEKCTAAREWNLHVVNHLWLEDSYAKWHPQTVSAPRYTHFPKRTNLGEVVGQTRIDRFAVEAHFFPSESNGGRPGDKAGTANAMRLKDKNIPVGQPPENNEERPKANQVKPDANSNAVTPKAVKESKPASAKSSKKSEDKTAFQTPVVSKFISEDKENATPPTTGSRKSKDAASARLHDYAPDIALYEKERKRAGGVIYGGRRKSDDQVVARKRSAEPEDESEVEEPVETKKTKKGRPPISMHLLITGYEPWIGNPKTEDSDKRHLRDLGILLSQDAAKCTHLAAPSILRTIKFVKAIAYAPKIVNCDFVTDCLKKDRLLDPDDYILQDEESEEKYDFTLEEARLRAKENKNKLLQGRTIYCMENIRGGFEALKSIIEVNGGQCATFRGRSGTVIPSRRAADDDDTSDSAPERDVYLISETENSHKKLWPKFQNMVRNAKKTPNIVRAAWLLDSVLCQELRWKDEWQLGEDETMSDE